MITSTVILSVSALALFLLNWRKNGEHVEGLKQGVIYMLQTLPLIIGAFILAGLIEVLIPTEFVHSWLSAEAGIRGIFLGTIGGMLMAVGPYAAFPIIASVMASGAGLGTVIAAITGWCLLGMSKLPFETAFLGAGFYIRKTLISIPFCLLAGFVAYALEVLFL